MKKLFTSASVALIMVSTQAIANSGDMTFSGAVNNAACEVLPGSGAGGAANAIEVDLGTVNLDSVGSGETIGLQKTPFSLSVVCTAGTDTVTNVHMAFDPATGAGSGTDPYHRSLLQLSNPTAADSAKGVGIGLFDSSEALVKLDQNDKISAPFTSGGAGAGTATLDMIVAYMRNGESIAPGKGEGFLPFTLTYE